MVKFMYYYKVNGRKYLPGHLNNAAQREYLDHQKEFEQCDRRNSPQRWSVIMRVLFNEISHTQELLRGH